MGERFEPKAGWNSAEDNIVDDFYRKGLAGCTRYDRMTGFFNSNAFAVAMDEVLNFVERGGRIRLITSAEFSQADMGVITDMTGRLAGNVSTMLKDDIGSKCLAVFGHMLSTRIDGVPQLDIKILIPERGIFHPKVGVFTMQDGETISFSGSVNETGMGWTGNVEEFKAFCSWKDREFVDIDVANFQKFWNNDHPDIHTYDLPSAVREKIINVRPESDEEYLRVLRQLRDALDRRRKSMGSNSGKHDSIVLRGYQKKAINNWVLDGYRGILEMPTATGKTFTAMGCINSLQKERKRLFVVIAVPYQHLTQQWTENVHEWNDKAAQGQGISSNILNTTKSKKWDHDLLKAVSDFNDIGHAGDHATNDYIVCTTYSLLSKPKFMDAIKSIDGNLLLVADEAHHTGAKTTQKGLLTEYSARLALTATPKRHFDEEGSNLIQEYFNGVSHSMEIGEAIKGKYLSPYEYHPVFVDLTADEITEYMRLTKLIIIDHTSKEKDKKPTDRTFHNENKRAIIVAKAEQKYQKLEEILESYGGGLEHAIIYCHDGKQLEKVGRILSVRNISYDIIDASTDMAETRAKLKGFTWKDHKCIVAMKCLDEGVDVPSAQVGIIMASTGNPLQYIQRRGRFLRKYQHKKHATIYDMLVAAPESDREYVYARKLIAKELLRHKEFANDARNRDEAFRAIWDEADKFGIDVDKLDINYVLNL